MGVAIRVAEACDVEQIAEAYIASWRAGYAGLLDDDLVDELAVRRSERDRIPAIESATSAVLVAVDGERIVGVVEADEHLDEPLRDLPEITMLYVVPSAWGTSVASDLLANATSWLAAKGHDAPRLRVVEQQARARRFYERERWVIDPGLAPATNGLFALIYYRRSLVSAR